MTDPEWEVLGPEAEALMAELRAGRGGRAMSHDPRAMLDAIRYVTKYGVECRYPGAAAGHGGHRGQRARP